MKKDHKHDDAKDYIDDDINLWDDELENLYDAGIDESIYDDVDVQYDGNSTYDDTDYDNVADYDDYLASLDDN